MSIILNFLENVVTPYLGKLRLWNNRYVNVIYYHDIVLGTGNSFDRTNIVTFKKQMEYILSEGYETLLFQDLNNPECLKFRKKRVLISFDDGWKSNYTEIFDYMLQRGIKYNVFLIVGKIGENPDYLNWEMVKKMNDSGIVGFGVHTYSHIDMTDVRIVDTSKEITEANEIFHREIGRTPEDFCYPFGYYSEESNHYLERNSGYKRIYTSKKMYSYKENDVIIFGRNGISEDHSMRVFKRKLKGYYNSYKTVETLFVQPLVSLRKKLKRKS